MSAITATVEEVEKSTSELQQIAISLWEIDRNALQKSDGTARDLGAALIKVKAVLPYSEYEPWLKQEGIKKNRASYCVRLVTGKVKKAKEERAKQPKVYDIKKGMLIRVQDQVFSIRMVAHPTLIKDKPGLDKKYCGTHYVMLEVDLQKEEDLTEEVTPSTTSHRPELTAPGARVTFKVAELKQCLAKLSKVAAARSHEPIFTNLRIFTADNIIKLQAADSDSSLTLKTGAIADGTLDFLLELAELTNIVSTLMSVRATITLRESEATISAKDFSGKLKLKDSPKFIDLPIIQAIPMIEDLELDGRVLPFSDLKEQIEQIKFAIPKHATKFVSEAALIEAGNGRLNVVATDGKMMAVSTVKNELLTGDTSMMIERPALELLSKLEGGTTVKIVDMESQFVFITDLELATHDKTHSEFPPYARIFPTDAYATKVTFHDKDKLISVLKRHRSLSKEDTFDVSLRVDVEMQRLSMTTLNVDRLSTGDVFHEVACDMIKVEATGDAFTTTLDANRLITFLGHAVFPVTMLVPASSAVGVKRILDFHSSGGTQEEPTYRFLLLPLRSGPMMSTAAPAPEPTSVDDRVPAVIA